MRQPRGLPRRLPGLAPFDFVACPWLPIPVDAIRGNPANTRDNSPEYLGYADLAGTKGNGTTSGWTFDISYLTNAPFVVAGSFMWDTDPGSGAVASAITLSENVGSGGTYIFLGDLSGAITLNGRLDGGTTFNVVGPTTTSAGVIYHCAAMVTLSEAVLWVNGVRYSSTGASVAGTATYTSFSLNSGTRAGSPVFPSASTTFWGGFGFRGVSEGYLQALSVDPWQFFDENYDESLAGVLSSGDIAGTNAMTLTNAGTLTGDGALSGANAITLTNTGTLTGAGDVAGTNAITFTNSGALTGDAAAAGSNAITLTNTGTLVGEGALSGNNVITFTNTGTLDAPAGAMTGTNAITITNAGTLLGDGALAGTDAITLSNTGTLAGEGALAGTNVMTFTNTGTLELPGAMTGTNAITITNAATLLGNGELTGINLMTMANSGSLDQPQVLSQGGHFGFDEKRRKKRFDDDREDEERRKRILREALYGLPPEEREAVTAQPEATIKVAAQSEVDYSRLLTRIQAIQDRIDEIERQDNEDLKEVVELIRAGLI